MNSKKSQWDGWRRVFRFCFHLFLFCLVYFFWMPNNFRLFFVHFKYCAVRILTPVQTLDFVIFFRKVLTFYFGWQSTWLDSRNISWAANQMGFLILQAYVVHGSSKHGPSMCTECGHLLLWLHPFLNFSTFQQLWLSTLCPLVLQTT